MEYISHISKDVIKKFADRITQDKGRSYRIQTELNNAISVYYSDYSGGHYTSDESVKFTDLSYKVNNKEADIKEAAIWAHCVYQNLPKQYKSAYVKKWNQHCKLHLDETKLVIANKQMYMLPEVIAKPIKSTTIA